MARRGAPSHRKLIERMIKKSTLHPTADEVFNRARKIEPSISLATVYRNLRALVADGEIRERNFEGVSRFDPNRHPHGHLICTTCGTIADFAPDVERLLSPVQDCLQGWSAEEFDLEVRGLCPSCLQDGSAPARPRAECLLVSARGKR